MASWNFPYELIREILSWLPAKSLMRFKRVSKQWRHLITNPDLDFLKLHLKRSFFAKPGLLVVRKTYLETQFDYAQDYTSCNNLTRFEIHFPSPFPSNLRVVNVCNGLLCLVDFYPYGNHKVYVWNSITGDHITIPSSPIPPYFFPDDDRFRQLDILYGFGFDPASDAYKVIRFASASPFQIGGDSDSNVTVYTLGQDSSWRTLPKIPYNISADNVSTALLNGFLHWFGPKLNESTGRNSPKQFLIAFNMQAETFQEIPLPHGISSDYELTVGVLDGLLCIFCSLEDRRHFDKDQNHLDVEIWVMGEYGVADSWRKHCKIVCPGVSGGSMRLLGDADSQEIIISREAKELFSYDLETDSLRNLHTVDSNHDSDVWETQFFKGSLLSPTIINGASRPAT